MGKSYFLRIVCFGRHRMMIMTRNNAMMKFIAIGQRF